MTTKLSRLLLILGIFAAFASVSLGQRCTEDGSIRSVTKARVGNFETVTFLINADSADYEVTNAKRPFYEYGEEEKPLRISGKYFKTINFKSVFWTCKISESLRAATTTIMDVKNIEQFEGYVVYAIGYRTKLKYVSTTETKVGRRLKVVMKFKR